MSPERYEVLNKLLGSPVIFSFDEETLKAKNRLLVISIISIVISVFGVSISAESTLFGLKFNNLNNSLLINLLLVFTLFFLVRFTWAGFELYQEWRVRVTGSGLAAVPEEGFLNSCDADITTDIRNTSLYNWWRLQGHDFKPEKIIEIKNDLEEIKFLLKEKNGSLDNEGGVHRKMKEIESHLSLIGRVLSNDRIEYSLQRFDKVFWLFFNMQNWRWITLDFVLPILLGVTSISLLLFYNYLEMALFLFWI